MTELHVTAPAGADPIRVIQTVATLADQAKKKVHRKINDLSSFIAYLQKWGNGGSTVIYWTPAGAIAVVDEDDVDSGHGDQDTVSFRFTRPLVARRWLDAIGTTFDHKGFKEFLELRHGEIQGGPGLYALIANLSLAQTFTYDGKLDSEQDYQIAFKAASGADVVKLPKTVDVHIPLIDGLEAPFRLALRLKFKAPTSADGTPTFRLTWDDQEDVFEDAARMAVTAMAEALPAMLVVHGDPNIRGVGL